MSDSEKEIKPAVRNPWFLLATVAGVPRGEPQKELIAENARHWNRAMYLIFRSALGEYCQSIGEDASIYHSGAQAQEAAFKRLNGEGFDLADIARDRDVIDLTDTVFDCPVFWDGFIFPVTVDFARTRFRKPVTFRSTAFASNANFMDAHFEESCAFNKAQFLDDVMFADTTFHQDVSFRATEFGTSFDFYSADFLGEADFQSARMDSPGTFDLAVFRRVPLFFGANLHENIAMNRALMPWDFDDRDTAWEAVPRYERLAQEMDRLQRYEDRHQFFRHAMRARRYRDGPDSLEGTLNSWYEKLADYGFGVGQALRAWFLSMFIGWLALFTFVFRGAADKQAVPKFWQNGWWESFHFGQALNDAIAAATLSFANSHAILGLNRVFMKSTYGRFDTTSPHYAGVSETAIFWFNLIGGIQTVAGAIMLFFVLLTLRNRFRMG